MSDKCRNCNEPLEGFETTLCYTCQGEKNECDEQGLDFWAMSEEDQETERWQDAERELAIRKANLAAEAYKETHVRLFGAMVGLNHDKFVYNGQFDYMAFQNSWELVAPRDLYYMGGWPSMCISEGAFCTVEHTYEEFKDWMRARGMTEEDQFINAYDLWMKIGDI